MGLATVSLGGLFQTVNSPDADLIIYRRQYGFKWKMTVNEVTKLHAGRTGKHSRLVGRVRSQLTSIVALKVYVALHYVDAD